MIARVEGEALPLLGGGHLGQGERAVGALALLADSIVCIPQNIPSRHALIHPQDVARRCDNVHAAWRRCRLRRAGNEGRKEGWADLAEGDAAREEVEVD